MPTDSHVLGIFGVSQGGSSSCRVLSILACTSFIHDCQQAFICGAWEACGLDSCQDTRGGELKPLVKPVLNPQFVSAVIT